MSADIKATIQRINDAGGTYISSYKYPTKYVVVRGDGEKPVVTGPKAEATQIGLWSFPFAAGAFAVQNNHYTTYAVDVLQIVKTSTTSVQDAEIWDIRYITPKGHFFIREGSSYAWTCSADGSVVLTEIDVEDPPDECFWKFADA